jgi:hypothetical protein
MPITYRRIPLLATLATLLLLAAYLAVGSGRAAAATCGTANAALGHPASAR